MLLTKSLEARGPFAIGDALSARSTWATARAVAGFSGYGNLLTPPNANEKIAKSERLIYSLSLAPANMAGVNVCAFSTAACRAVCVLKTAGNALYPMVQRARIVKTQFLNENPAAFVSLLASEIRRAIGKHGAENVSFRLNTASDIRWEKVAPELFSITGATFYDYTKYPAEHRSPGENYRLVFSVSERKTSDAFARDYLKNGRNVAVVFDTKKGHALPNTWEGFPVLDGDRTDDRTIDPAGYVVGLRAKGSARGKRGSATGFVRAAG